MGAHGLGELDRAFRRSWVLSRPPSVEEAWEIAWATALTLGAGERPPRAIAVTGSLARGDFVAGSDIDLWLLDNEDGRADVLVEGLEVSLLRTTLPFARSEEGLLRFEVRDAIPLVDPEGLFREIQALAEERGEALATSMMEGSLEVLLRLVERARRAEAPPFEVAALREVARRMACLFVTARRGWRVPRERHFAAVLDPDAMGLLRALLQLPRAWPSQEILDVALEERPPVVELGLPTPEKLAALRRGNRIFDAAVAVRQGLGPSPFDGELQLTEAQRELFRWAHGAVERVSLEGLWRGLRELHRRLSVGWREAPSDLAKDLAEDLGAWLQPP